MKRTFISTVSLLLTLFLAGCANQTSPVQKSTEPAPPSKTSPAQTAPTQPAPAQSPTAQDPYANVQVLKKTYQPATVPPGDKLDLSYPEVSGLPDAAVQKRINDFLQEKAIPQEIDDNADVTADFKVQYQKGKIVNLLLTGYEFRHGAAHEIPFQVSYILNLENGASYTLQDLFKPGSGYLDKLTKLVNASGAFNAIQSYGSFPGVKNTDSIYLDDGGFFINYSPYEYTPFVDGFPAFRISFRDVADQINQDGEFWQALPPQDLSKPTAQDLAYANYQKDVHVILAKGYQLQNSLLEPNATLTDASGNRLYVWFAERTANDDNQVYFFEDGTFLGTDTAKPYRLIPLEVKSNGTDAIIVTYGNPESTSEARFDVTYKWDGAKLTPDANFAKLAR